MLVPLKKILGTIQIMLSRKQKFLFQGEKRINYLFKEFLFTSLRYIQDKFIGLIYA